MKPSHDDPTCRACAERRASMSAALDHYLPERAVAERLKVHVRTLRRWSLLRNGPPRTKAGRRIFYDERLLDEWLRAQTAPGGRESA